MSRLTEMNKDACDLCNLDCKHMNNFCEKAKSYSRLKHYEDLEEQGRLIELPCKVGDTVWCLSENYDYTWDVIGYVFMGICNDYIIVTSEYMGMTFEEQLGEMCEEMIEHESLALYIFHKSKVFLTKEEAEAKLAELKGTEE